MPQSPITVYDVLAQRFATAPSAEAVIDGDLRLTNETLRTRVDAVAKTLLALGVGKGDRVATLASVPNDIPRTQAKILPAGQHPAHAERQARGT